MSDLDRHIEDMIAAAGLDDADADELRMAMAEVKARKDARLRGDVQRTVGQTHLTLREGMDRVIDLQVDTQGMVAGAVRQLESMEAALDQARAEFHSGLNAVGESVSELRGDVKGMRVELTEVSNDVGVLREEAKRQAARLSHLEAGQAAAVGQQNLQARQIRDLTRQIAEMRQEAAQRPSLEETKILVERINTDHARLNALEESLGDQ